MMVNLFYRFSAVICLVLLIALPVSAADKGDVVSELTAKKVLKGADNKEIFQPADIANPGDVIEYTAVYRNKGKDAAKDFKATLPVPQGMEYLSGTAKPEGFSASLDGKKYAPAPLKRKHKLPNGKEEVRDVPYSEYRFLQWDLNHLPAGKTATVVARMKISSATEPVKVKETK